MAISDKEQSAIGKVVKVGVDQLNNPTPIWIKYIFRTYTFLAGLWAIISPSITNIDEHTLAEINKWLLAGVPVIHYTIKFFGWDYKAN
jgi:hypothetical protein